MVWYYSIVEDWWWVIWWKMTDWRRRRHNCEQPSDNQQTPTQKFFSKFCCVFCFLFFHLAASRPINRIVFFRKTGKKSPFSRGTFPDLFEDGNWKFLRNVSFTPDWRPNHDVIMRKNIIMHQILKLYFWMAWKKFHDFFENKFKLFYYV